MPGRTTPSLAVRAHACMTASASVAGGAGNGADTGRLPGAAGGQESVQEEAGCQRRTRATMSRASAAATSAEADTSEMK